MISVAESLARFGLNPEENFYSREALEKQIEAYFNHVVCDCPVSNKYVYCVRYQENDLKIITENHQELYLDEEERGGLAKEGTLKAVSEALKHPRKIVFLYSPPGPVAFEKGTKYDKVPPYTSGQLYLMISNNPDQVEALAISISEEGEAKFLKEIDMKIFQGEDKIGKIKYYLSNPFVTNMSLDQLLEKFAIISKEEDFIVYQNVHGHKFSLSRVVQLVKKGWKRQIKPIPSVNDLVPQGKIKPFFAYLKALASFFPQGQSSLRLAGSCGGGEVTWNQISSLLDSFTKVAFAPLSPFYRAKDFFLPYFSVADSDEYGPLNFECPHCLSEVRRPRHQLLESCPYCNGDLRCGSSE
ncbi:MAG: hypothetical protein NZL96_02505 [Patescibacteria group bacterium]|nr:hypothetical protein [Patescibacteria group bacterium]